MEWDIIIIGAGPAGMAAAIQAAKHKAKVLVLDRQMHAGGQIFRSVNQASKEKSAALGKEYSRGKKLVQEFMNSNIEYIPQSTVWHIENNKVYASKDGKTEVFFANYILIATGAMERPVPIEGWTNPGVMGVGASDVLFKSASLLPKGDVVICGNGPLVLQSIAHMKKLNVPIAAIVLTNSFSNYTKALPSALNVCLRPLYFAHGAAIGLNAVNSKNLYFSAKNPKIEKNGEKLTFSFSTAKNDTKKIEADTVLLHEGVVPETRITRLARLEHIWNPQQRTWQVETNIWGKSNNESIRVAGDCAGVKGADAAMALGKLAALQILLDLQKINMQERNKEAKSLQRDVFRYTKMQTFLDIAFAPKKEMLCPSDETIVCRCEQITAKELREAITDGSYSQDGVKSQTRAGMGECQGRMCSSAVAEIISQTHGIPLENIEPYRAQFPLIPVHLDEIANMHIPPSTSALQK